MVAAGEPHRGVAGARASADRLIFKLKTRLVAADRKALAFESALLHLFGDAEVAERVACILPALTSPLAGERPEELDILRRNVALHSEGPCGVSLVSAGHAELRKAQKHARRLEARRADTQPAAHVQLQGFPPLVAESGLRRDAPPFVPSTGCWVPLDGCGRLCTCGATYYSSCSPLPLSVEEVFEDHGDEDSPCGEAAAAEFPTTGSRRGCRAAAPPTGRRQPVARPLMQDADVEAKLVADVIASVSEEVGDGIEGATLDGDDGGVDEKSEPTVELEALVGRLGALVEGAEPTVELEGDLAALSVRQGALEESAEAKCELEALSQRPCALEATSEQLVSQKGGLAPRFKNLGLELSLEHVDIAMRRPTWAAIKLAPSILASRSKSWTDSWSTGSRYRQATSLCRSGCGSHGANNMKYYLRRPVAAPTILKAIAFAPSVVGGSGFFTYPLSRPPPIADSASLWSFFVAADLLRIAFCGFRARQAISSPFACPFFHRRLRALVR
ncbi:unnamed protein product [Prorocentrum cordatum]|uniref:Uncharacterized protein n=1 Tax=Prorocentrum cordatum TaxID=2364126 RepID=A0ABN9SNU7_9DINO|nr:unnamed protein product [Polarella glacialis]